MSIENTILNILTNRPDNCLQMTAAEMGLTYTLDIDQQAIRLILQAAFPIAKLQQHFIPLLWNAIQEKLPQYHLEIQLEQKINAHRTQLVGKGLRGIKNTIAIASGKGGVGKSTITVNLAAALAQAGARVGILDADIYGPSIPRMLGQHQPIEIVSDRYLPVNAHGLQAMSIGYLTEQENALIWRGPMLAKSLLHLIEMTHWDNLDYLLIDLPPGTGDIQLSLVQKIPLTAAVVVTTPQEIATLDAAKALKMFATTNIHTLGLIENMSLHHCTQCGHQEAIFGQQGAQKLADRYQCDLLGQLPLDSQIGLHCEQGIPTATKLEMAIAEQFEQIALKTSVVLGKRPLNYMDKFPPIVAR